LQKYLFGQGGERLSVSTRIFFPRKDLAQIPGYKSRVSDLFSGRRKLSRKWCATAQKALHPAGGIGGIKALRHKAIQASRSFNA